MLCFFCSRCHLAPLILHFKQTQKVHSKIVKNRLNCFVEECNFSNIQDSILRLHLSESKLFITAQTAT